VGEAQAAAARGGPCLAFGQGRSYGDLCLNDGGVLIDTKGLDRFISLDHATGVLVCEAGVTLEDIHQVLERRIVAGHRWFMPVLPGTKFVTIGGAIANDIHGKNHHLAGTFGRHVLWLELVRSDGSLRRCSSNQHSELFAATIGGLGLTGLVVKAAIQLVAVPSWSLEVEEIAFDNLREFYAVASESVDQWQHTAAWVDCLAQGKKLGRGIFTRSRHAVDSLDPEPAQSGPRISVPFDAPNWLLNGATLQSFNALYRHKLLGRKRVTSVASYQRVLYPLDAIGNWNRLYGRRGFFQYQCVVPPRAAYEAMVALLEAIARARQGSFLLVLKTFGDLPSPGLLSFPMEGTTLALDFPNRGASTLALLESLDDIVQNAGGRVYPAKDGRMSAARFRAYYSNLDRFVSFVDPNFSSSFWRRMQST